MLSWGRKVDAIGPIVRTQRSRRQRDSRRGDPISPLDRRIIFVPAGSPVRTRSSGHKDELHIFLEPGVVERVAAEAFEFDPARVSIPRPTACNTLNSGPRC